MVPPLFGSSAIIIAHAKCAYAIWAAAMGASLMHPCNAGSTDLPTARSAHRLASELPLAPHAARFQSRRAIPCTRASQGTLSVIGFHHDTACAPLPQPRNPATPQPRNPATLQPCNPATLHICTLCSLLFFCSRQSTLYQASLCPSIDPQPSNPLKLPCVVRHQHHIERQRMCGDKCVKRTERPYLSL